MNLLMQLLQQSITIDIIERQHHGFNFLRAVIQATLFIGDSPQTSEENARQRLTFCKLVVREKAGFDISRSGHLILHWLFWAVNSTSIKLFSISLIFIHGFF
jgi:hypothetical protein